MAGSEEQSPSMSTEQLVQLITQAKRTPVERDTLYRVIKDYSKEQPISVANASLN
jgi:aminodeoxyfutalosine synthase